MRSPNHSGGGAQTNVNGLGFERAKELRGIIASGTGITVSGNTVFQNGEEIAILYQKHELYKYLLKPNGIDYRDHISKKLLPDDAIYFPHLERPILYIIEKKYQNGGGSVDEKLQTCDFKKRQ